MPENLSISSSDKGRYGFHNTETKRTATKNSKKKKFLYAFLFTALSFASIFFVGRAYEAAAAKNKVNIWNKRRFDDFYKLERNTLDMVFIGSSHSYCSFDPEEIDRLLDIKSYQLGMPLQSPDSSYYTLLEVFNYQHPGMVVLELYWDLMSGDFDPKQSESLFQVMDNEGIKEDYIRYGFPLSAKIMHYLKPIRFQTDFIALKNSELLGIFKDEPGLVKTEGGAVGEEFYKSKGFIFCDYVMSAEEYDSILLGESVDGSEYKISKRQLYYINKIIELCRQKQTELVFVTAPVANVTREKIMAYSVIHNSVATIARQNDIAYLDFNLNGPMFADTDFRDKNHLNYMGAKKACEYFAGWINRQTD